MEHASSQEEHFDGVLADYYGVSSTRESARFGAVLVFHRKSLADLELEHVDDIGEGREQEERVQRDLDRLRDRLAAVVCDLGEIEWFERIVDVEFRKADENVQWALDALQVVKGLAVDRNALAPGYNGHACMCVGPNAVRL